MRKRKGKRIQMSKAESLSPHNISCQPRIVIAIVKPQVAVEKINTIDR